jgi:hypothetical protein
MRKSKVFYSSFLCSYRSESATPLPCNPHSPARNRPSRTGREKGFCQWRAARRGGPPRAGAAERSGSACGTRGRSRRSCEEEGVFWGSGEGGGKGEGGWKNTRFRNFTPLAQFQSSYAGTACSVSFYLSAVAKLLRVCASMTFARAPETHDAPCREDPVPGWVSLIFLELVIL